MRSVAAAAIVEPCCRAGGKGRGAEADRKCTLEGLADTRKQIWMTG